MDAIKIDRERRESRKLWRIRYPESSLLCRAVVGYFFPRYPSAMDKVSSHFERSPLAHPQAVFFSSSRLSPSLLCLSIFQRFALASVTLVSDRSLPLPLSSVLLFLWISFGVFRAARETSSACRNEFHVSTDSLIADGLDDRVNRWQRMSPFFILAFFASKILMCKKVSLVKA